MRLRGIEIRVGISPSLLGAVSTQVRVGFLMWDWSRWYRDWISVHIFALILGRLLVL